jgi:mannose-6-phosphate isomerase-like protein (cupin superfamily)
MTKGKMPQAQIKVSDALSRLPGPDGDRYVSMLDYEDLELEFYAPRGTDPQNPHTRDEIYVVIQGQGTFVNGDQRQSFEPGDVLFVPAHVLHRFEEFTDDLMVWAFFLQTPEH